MNQKDLIKGVRRFTKTEEQTLSDSEIIDGLNEWLDQTCGWIEDASAMWKFDDENYNEFPIAQANLEKNQWDYELPHGVMKIENVEVKTKDGHSRKLQPINKKSINRALGNISSGTPKYYSLSGNSIKLAPYPSYDKKKGLMVFYTRNPKQFKEGEDEFEPAIHRAFRRILMLGVSMDWCIANANAQKETAIRRQIFGDATVPGMKEELEKFYSTRSDDRSPRMSVAPKTYNYRS